MKCQREVRVAFVKFVLIRQRDSHPDDTIFIAIADSSLLYCLVGHYCSAVATSKPFTFVSIPCEPILSIQIQVETLRASEVPLHERNHKLNQYIQQHTQRSKPPPPSLTLRHTNKNTPGISIHSSITTTTTPYQPTSFNQPQTNP